MGIRDTALSPKDPEPINNYNPNNYDEFGMYDPYHHMPTGYTQPTWQKSAYKPPIQEPGMLEIKLIIPFYELSEHCRPENEGYNYSQMINEAEYKATEKLEEFAGINLTNRYNLTFTSEEGLDEVEVTATLTPLLKTKI